MNEIEAHLACGDTISLATRPPIGAYRHCIHCDTGKRVTAVVEHEPALVELDELEPRLVGPTLTEVIEAEARARAEADAAAVVELFPMNPEADELAVERARELAAADMPEGLYGHEQTLWLAEHVSQLRASVSALAFRLERRLR